MRCLAVAAVTGLFVDLAGDLEAGPGFAEGRGFAPLAVILIAPGAAEVGTEMGAIRGISTPEFIT
jgi:hypothetical protein